MLVHLACPMSLLVAGPKLWRIVVTQIVADCCDSERIKDDAWRGVTVAVLTDRGGSDGRVR